MSHSKSSFYWTVSDWRAAIRRSSRHIFRNPDSLITGMMLPVIIMLLFVIVFGGAVNTGVAYVNYVVPGVILICVGYGSSTTAMIVNRDITGGLFDRFRTLPMVCSSVLIGHIVGSLLRNVISAVLVFGVALAIGFRPNATLIEWLVIAGILVTSILAISWLSAGFGLLAKSMDTASAISFIIMFLPYLSSAFVPVETMPSWLHGFAQHQPFTPIIETLRGLMIGTPIGDNGLLTAVWSTSILLGSMVIALSLFRYRAHR